mgnify:FL=1
MYLIYKFKNEFGDNKNIFFKLQNQVFTHSFITLNELTLELINNLMVLQHLLVCVFSPKSLPTQNKNHNYFSNLSKCIKERKIK